jgi:hypothetical protein
MLLGGTSAGVRRFHPEHGNDEAAWLLAAAVLGVPTHSGNTPVCWLVDMGQKMELGMCAVCWGGDAIPVWYMLQHMQQQMPWQCSAVLQGMLPIVSTAALCVDKLHNTTGGLERVGAILAGWGFCCCTAGVPAV